MSEIEIRVPRREEFGIIDVMANDFFDYYFGGDVEFETAIDQIEASFEAGLLFVADLEGELIGFIGGLTGPLIGCPSVVIAFEQAWWVEPGSRGHRAGLGLIEAFESEAKLMGCDYVSMVALDKNDKIASIYTLMDYSLKESTFVKRLR